MTDFPSFSSPTAARRAIRSTSSTRRCSRIGRRRARRRIGRCSKAHRFDGKTGFAFVHPAAPGRRVRGRRGGRRCRRAFAMVPCQARREPAGGHLRLAQGEPGPAALGWLLAQHRFDAYRSQEGRSRTRPARPASPAKRRGSTRSVRLAEADRAGPRPRQHARRRPRPRRARASRPRAGRAHRRRGPSHLRRGSGRRLSADRRGRARRVERTARRG